MGKRKHKITESVEYLAPLFGAHTHLTSYRARTPEKIAALMDRATAANVVGVCTVGDGMPETELASAAAHTHPNVWAAVTIHPTRVQELDDDAKARLTEMVADPRVVVVGEMGLDWYWLDSLDSCTSESEQLAALQRHVELATTVGKPLMIRNRDADEGLMAALDDYDSAVILHCFSSFIEATREAIARNYLLSFTGNVTFKRDDYLRQAVAEAPAEQLLVEIDAPYMTAESFQGARSKSTFIGHQARAMAAARETGVEEIAQILTGSACRVYGT